MTANDVPVKDPFGTWGFFTASEASFQAFFIWKVPSEVVKSPRVFPSDMTVHIVDTFEVHPAFGDVNIFDHNRQEILRPFKSVGPIFVKIMPLSFFHAEPI